MPIVPPRFRFSSILSLQFTSAPLQSVGKVATRMMSFGVPSGSFNDSLIPTGAPKAASARLPATSRNESNLASRISLTKAKLLFPLLSGSHSQLKAMIRKNLLPRISASMLDSSDPHKFAGLDEALGRSSTRVSAQSKSDMMSRAAESEVEKQLGIGINPNTTCTADELHYVDAGAWKLALWRYLPNPNAPKRKHPVLMLCGVATNALGYDLDPDVSLARYLKNQGFESWILEVRGAGFSHLAENEAEAVQSLLNRGTMPLPDDSDSDASSSLSQTMETLQSGSAESLLDSLQAAEGQNAKKNGVDIARMQLEMENVEEAVSGSDTEAEEVGERKGVKRKRNDSQMVLVSGTEPQASKIAATVGQLKEQLGNLLEEGQLAALRNKYTEIREISGKLLEAVGQRTGISDRVNDVSEQIKGLLEEGSKTGVASRLGDLRAAITKLQEDRQTGSVPQKVTELTDRLTNVLDEAQKSALTGRISGMIENVTRVLGDGQRAALAGRIQDLMDRLASLLEESQRSSITARIADLRLKMEGLLEESQTVASPQARFRNLLSDTSKSIGMLRKYDWDFDTLLHEDLPAAIRIVLEKSNPEDGKILGVGHSMGGIMLLCRLAVLGTDSQLKAVVTVASAMQYGMSNSSLKLALPLATPARLAALPVIPLGVMARTALPLIVRPPYTLAYFGYQVSARKMMDPTLFRKLFAQNFCTIPVKLLLQLASLFYDSGLRDREGKVMYAEGLKECKVPVLALAGNKDLICPAIAVTETMKLFPEGSVEYKLFGDDSSDRNYAHYDLLVGVSAKTEVFPVILDFLIAQDGDVSENGSASTAIV